MSRNTYQTSQNVDNFLREKPSTRLHAPPGGGSTVGSLIFGGGAPADESPFAGYERRGSNSRRKEETPEAANPYTKDNRFAPQQAQAYGGHQQQAPPQQQPAHRQASSNQYATGASQNTGNVLTDRRITRIHAPPGGASSIRFG